MTRDERPFVSGLLNRGSEGLGRIVKRAVLSMGRGAALVASGLITLAVFLVFLVRGVLQTPGFDGLLAGVTAASIAALACAAAVAWTLIWAFSGDARAPGDSSTAATIDDALAPALRELDIVRAEVIAAVARRSVLRVPLGIAAACLLWGLLQLSPDRPDPVALIVFALVGALLGEGWAIGSLARRYRGLFKRRVLPHLAAQFGDLTYSDTPAVDRVQVLRRYRILPETERLTSDDEIRGVYRGRPISITEVRLDVGAGDDARSLFDGLLIEITLPQRLAGTTVVVPDEAVPGRMSARWQSSALRRVRIEDVSFDARYLAYGSDPAEARRLLTPAFIKPVAGERSTGPFVLRGVLAEGETFLAALSKRRSVDLFEPPPYWSRAGAQALVALRHDIATVLEAADSVIAAGS